MIGGLFTSSPASLALSLLFGVAQLVVGVAVAFRLLTHARWRQTRLFVLLLVSVWFAVSGLTELFVSGMEAAHGLFGVLTVAEFTLWRGRADTALAGVSLVLALVFVAGLVMQQLHRFERTS